MGLKYATTIRVEIWYKKMCRRNSSLQILRFFAIVAYLYFMNVHFVVSISLVLNDLYYSIKYKHCTFVMLCIHSFVAAILPEYHRLMNNILISFLFLMTNQITPVLACARDYSQISPGYEDTSEVAGLILSENVFNVTRTQCSTYVKRVSQHSATLCRNAWVFSGRSGFLPQGS